MISVFPKDPQNTSISCFECRADFQMQEVQHPLQTRRRPPSKKNHTANASYHICFFSSASEVLTSFLAIFGVVFLNLEVLKRFMLPSQTDFSAFRVSLSSWLVLAEESSCYSWQLRVAAQVFARFALRSCAIGRGFLFRTCCCVYELPRITKRRHPPSFVAI